MPNKIRYARPRWLPAAAEAARQYDRTPRRAADNAFYNSTPWRKLKNAYRSEHPLCQPCRAQGRLIPTAIVHHKIPRHERPDLALDWDNLESVCHKCHGERHARTEK